MDLGNSNLRDEKEKKSSWKDCTDISDYNYVLQSMKREKWLMKTIGFRWSANKKKNWNRFKIDFSVKVQHTNASALKESGQCISW